MNRREIVRTVLEGGRPPYVPWNIGFTRAAADALRRHVGQEDLDPFTQPHFAWMEWPTRPWRPLPGARVEDDWGVVWDRSVDEDIGVVENRVLPEPTLKDFVPPAVDDAPLARIDQVLAERGDRLRLFGIGFSLYERAWTLRGMENLMMDFIEHPRFVHELLDRLADHAIARVRKALTRDIDAVYFGDDWGQQHGLQMGYPLWKEFIRPRLARMYGAVREAGRYVVIHSCGDVDELFDDLIAIGLNCFNPFQPEVMDVAALHAKYRGRLAFYGGLSTQRTLPYGTTGDVRAETRRLLAMGRDGGYIFAPAHAIEGDVPLENMLAMLDELKRQPGAGGS